MAIKNFYVPRQSSYRNLSAPTKFILPLVLMTTCFLLNHPLWNFAMIPVVIALLVWAKIPRPVVKSFATILYTLVPIISISWILFLREGSLLYQLGFVRIYSGAIIRAVSMSFRFTAIVLSVPLILGTMSQEEMVAGLRKMRLPYSVCFIIALTFRLIPTLEGDIDTIREAQMSRGIEFEKASLLQKVKNFASILIPLFTVSIDRIDTLGRVIECRGISYSKGRDKTFYKEPTITLLDYMLMLAALALLAAIVFFRYRYGYFVY